MRRILLAQSAGYCSAHTSEATTEGNFLSSFLYFHFCASLSFSVCVLQRLCQLLLFFWLFQIFSIFLVHYFPFIKFLEPHLLFFLFLLKIYAQIMNFHCLFLLLLLFLQYMHLGHSFDCTLNLDLTPSHQFHVSDIQYYSVQNISNCCDFSLVPLVMWNSVF